MKLRDAAKQNWDAIVVGAGPAGSVAARQLALAAAKVLLVDKAPRGRWKVCGCCLNAAAIQTLTRISLEHILPRCGAVPLRAIHIAASGCQATLGLRGASLSREAFDAALVDAAVSAGVEFLPRTHAALRGISGDFRELMLKGEHDRAPVNARVVLVADGLGGSFRSHGTQPNAVVHSNSRVGAGITLEAVSNFIEPGAIYMACGKNGYVGLVRLEDGRLNAAAALDLDQVRRAGGPGPLAAEILNEVGWYAEDDIVSGIWRGTPALTRHADLLACERVLVLGDAAGYVEPFTGEGMAWALASAVVVTPLAVTAIGGWSPRVGREWEHLYRSAIARRQSTCRQVAWGLRHPRVARAAIRLLSRYPQLAGPIVRRLNTP